jgi:hypothetical protein
MSDFREGLKNILCEISSQFIRKIVDDHGGIIEFTIKSADGCHYEITNKNADGSVSTATADFPREFDA